MANAFLHGVQTGILDNQDDRRAKQIELNNFINGYEQNAQGDYAPNQRGQRRLDRQDEVVKQELMKLQAQNEAIAATQNTNDMTQATTQLVMGKQDEAWRIVNKNPILKDQLLQQFGAANIMPIDFANDSELLKGAGIDISDEALSKSEVRNALNSSVFKIVGPDGKVKLGNTQQLIKSTNYMQYASEEDRTGVEARVNKISEILSGHIKTPEQRAAKADGQTTAAINSGIDKNIASLREEYYNGIFEDTTLSAEEKLAKIQGVKGVSKKALELQINQEKLKQAKSKTNVDLATEADDIAKAKADAAASKAKADAGKPVPGEAEFISSLRDEKKVPFTDESLNKARKVQGNRTLTAERAKEVNGRFAMAKSFHNFTNKFIAMDMNRDAVAKLGTTLDKLIKPGMTGQDQQRVLNNIEIDTELRALVSEYVKFMSGAAVTTEEFNRYNDITQGGAWSSRESATEALRSFTDYLRTSSKDRVDGLVDLPYDYLVKRNDYSTWSANNPAITREASRKKSAPAKQSMFSKFRR